MKLKGKTTIELTDVNTGEVTTVEHENMLTNALNIFFNHNPMGLFNTLVNTRTIKQFNKYFIPICPNLLGGILLFPETLEENADKILIGSGELPMAYASNNANPYDDTMRGSMNLNESMAIDNGYKFVWDFTTSQGNGTIAALALTSCYGGAAVYGNTYDDTSPWFLMKHMRYLVMLLRLGFCVCRRWRWILKMRSCIPLSILQRASIFTRCICRFIP